MTDKNEFDDRFDNTFNDVFDDTFDIKKTREEDFSLIGDKQFSEKHFGEKHFADKNFDENFEDNHFEDFLSKGTIKNKTVFPTAMIIKKKYSSLFIAMSITLLALAGWTLYETLAPKHLNTKAVIKKIIHVSKLKIPVLSNHDHKKATETL